MSIEHAESGWRRWWPGHEASRLITAFHHLGSSRAHIYICRVFLKKYPTEFKGSGFFMSSGKKLNVFHQSMMGFKAIIAKVYPFIRALARSWINQSSFQLIMSVTFLDTLLRKYCYHHLAATYSYEVSISPTSMAVLDLHIITHKKGMWGVCERPNLYLRPCSTVNLTAKHKFVYSFSRLTQTDHAFCWCR